MSSKSSSSSHKKTTSLESVSSELNVLDLADDLYYNIYNYLTNIVCTICAQLTV